MTETLPTLAALPPPPEGLAGWPWTAEENEEGGDSGPWPRISVITPSFNQGDFLEMTIRSVLLQGYPDLEYIVIDGGSTDRSVSLIRKYEPWIDYWISERDRGQSHAINKGLERASGEILCWLNSDDYYLPGTLRTVGRWLARGTGHRAIAGHVLKVYTDGRPPVLLEGKYEGRRRLLQFWKGYQMHQAAIFWRREVTERIGLLDERLHLIMDFDYWARIAEHDDFANVDRVLAACHYHAAAKTGDAYESYYADLRRHAWRYWGSPWRAEFWGLGLEMAREIYAKLKRTGAQRNRLA